MRGFSLSMRRVASSGAKGVDRACAGGGGAFKFATIGESIRLDEFASGDWIAVAQFSGVDQSPSTNL